MHRYVSLACLLAKSSTSSNSPALRSRFSSRGLLSFRSCLYIARQPSPRFIDGSPARWLSSAQSPFGLRCCAWCWRHASRVGSSPRRIHSRATPATDAFASAATVALFSVATHAFSQDGGLYLSAGTMATFAGPQDFEVGAKPAEEWTSASATGSDRGAGRPSAQAASGSRGAGSPGSDGRRGLGRTAGFRRRARCRAAIRATTGTSTAASSVTATPMIVSISRTQSMGRLS